jgi:hypothetical protein
LNIISLNQDTSSIANHLRAHFDHREEDQMYCPASSKGGAGIALCGYDLPMTRRRDVGPYSGRSLWYIVQG